MKFVFYIFVLSGLMVFTYVVGPEPQFDDFDNQPLFFSYPLSELNTYLSARESKFKDLKIANEARILWNNSTTKAPCAIVYLHGFSASQAEGAPVHRNVAEQFGCNLYLTRLPGHGIDSNDAFRQIEPRDWVQEAKQAVAIGKLIGERVIVMATSTGASLAAYLAAADKEISALILFSPNFDLYDQKSHLLNGPWGRAIARIFFNGEYREWEAPAEVRKYWTTRYHLDGLHSLRHLITKTMTSEVFSRIEQPVFVGYYYRDEDHQDEFVSVKLMHDFMRQISTPKRLQRSYQAIHANTHPIASQLWNKRWEEVQDATTAFMVEVLEMKYLCGDCQPVKTGRGTSGPS